MPLPDGAHVDRVGVDDEGVKLALFRQRERTLEGFDWEGEPIDVRSVPPVQEGPLLAWRVWPFGERTLERHGQRLVVRDRDGAVSPALPAHSHFVGVEGDTVVSALRTSTRDHSQVLRVERFVCSGEALGVPDRWMPQR